MDSNNQTFPDESKMGQEPVRCDALTRTGTPCKNLAIADGRCWIHGGRKKKFPAEDENISMKGPATADTAVESDQAGIDAHNAVGTDAVDQTPAAGDPEAIEISAADIELISEGRAPGGLPEVAALPPAEAGQAEIVWEAELPDKASPSAGTGKLEILWEDELPDEEPPEDGMELGIEIDAAGEAEFEDLELEILPDDELPVDEISPGFGHAADNEGTDAYFSEGGPGYVAGAEDEDIILEMLPDADPAPDGDAADIEIEFDDDPVLDSGDAAAISGYESAPGSEDDWLGVNDINRFGAVTGRPEVNDVPEPAATEKQQPNRHVPEASYRHHPDTGAGDAAPEYKIRTTIGKFQEIHVDTSRKGERKKIKGGKPPVKKAESFWRRRVGIPAPVFWGMTWLLLILGGISLLHYGFGIHIPYASGMLLPKVKDAGNLQIVVYGTESRFVQNSHSGMLLVITGWVRNDYNAPRGRIRVTGKLFTYTHFVKSQTVYCGDLISDQELGGLSAEIIQKRLSDRQDDIGLKEMFDPRQTLPFMIVFSQLPDDLASLEKYTVEVTDSSPVR